MPDGVSVGRRRRGSWKRGSAVEQLPTVAPFAPRVQINRRPGSLETAASEDCHPARSFPTFSTPLQAESTRDTDSRYRKENIRVVPEFAAQQSKRIAKVALDYYNRKKKIKFELLNVRPVNFVPTKWRPYIHINFFARSTKEGSKE